MNDHPPLKPLHSDVTLSRAKLAIFERQTAEELRLSLQLGQEHCLKTRPDGTMLDGHHRVYVLRARGEDVDCMPREVIAPNAP